MVTRIALEPPPDRPHLYLLTITAPGTKTDHPRFHDFEALDTWGPIPSPRPICGCEDSLGEMADWNASAARRWNVLRGQIRRAYPGVQYMRAVEVQNTRPALHLHIIVASYLPLDPHELQRLAISAGFGCVMNLAHIAQGSKKHAYYVAKYVTKATDSRQEIPWTRDYVDQDSGEITQAQGPATYRTWSSSREWGLTMKDLKAGIAADRAKRLGTPPVTTLDMALSAVLQGIPGSTILDVASP